MSHLSRTLVSDSGCSGSWCFGLYEFTLVFHLSPILVSHLFPTHVSHTCLPHLSATLVSHTVSHTCLPHLSPTLVSHFGCLGLYELTLASHLSPTLGCAVKTCREGCRNDTRCRKMTCNWFFLHLFAVNAGIIMMFLNVVCFSLVFFGFASLSRFLIFHPIARSFSTRRRVVLCVVFVFQACRCCMVQVLSAGRWWLMLQVGAGCSYVFRSSSINEAISQAIQQAILKPNYSYLFISRSLSPSMYLVIHLCSYLSMYLHIWTKWHIYI